MRDPFDLNFPRAIYDLTSRGNARQKVFLAMPTASDF
jgi:hypothetical protein